MNKQERDNLCKQIVANSGKDRLPEETPVIREAIERGVVQDTMDLVVKMGKCTDKEMQELTTATTQRVLEAATAVGQAGKALRDEVERLEATCSTAVEESRNKRFTLLVETAKITAALKEVREFFLGYDYEKEKQRLSEFVDLCERLKALSDSGFLDVVAGTMIQLAMKEK